MSNLNTEHYKQRHLKYFYIGNTQNLWDPMGNVFVSLKEREVDLRGNTAFRLVTPKKNDNTFN